MKLKDAEGPTNDPAYVGHRVQHKHHRHIFGTVALAVVPEDKERDWNHNRHHVVKCDTWHPDWASDDNPYFRFFGESWELFGTSASVSSPFYPLTSA